MKVAYIAGPYDSTSDWQRELNIMHAHLLAVKYWRLGYAVLCPHSNSAHFGGALDGYEDILHEPLTDEQWLRGYLELVSRCDVIVMSYNWETSPGARHELAQAKAHGLDVIYDQTRPLQI